ncbi:YtxH domain-containing protein [Flavitalea flava]
MDNSKLVLGFIAGAVVGGALGVLLAPDKGSETRKKIKEKGFDMTDSLTDKFNEVTDKFNEVVDGVKETFTKAKGEAKRAMP